MGRARVAALAWLVAVAGDRLAGAAGRAQAPADAAPQADALARRASARIDALQREADALASRERTLLDDLRKLEVERDLHAAKLAQLNAELARLETDLAGTTAGIAQLERAAAAQLPGLTARMVELYKLGNGGYLRLLLNVDDLRGMGRAYRFVSALQTADRDPRRRTPAHAGRPAAGAGGSDRAARPLLLQTRADVGRRARVGRAGGVRARGSDPPHRRAARPRRPAGRRTADRAAEASAHARRLQPRRGGRRGARAAAAAVQGRPRLAGAGRGRGRCSASSRTGGSTRRWSRTASASRRRRRRRCVPSTTAPSPSRSRSRASATWSSSITAASAFSLYGYLAEMTVAAGARVARGRPARHVGRSRWTDRRRSTSSCASTASRSIHYNG